MIIFERDLLIRLTDTICCSYVHIEMTRYLLLRIDSLPGIFNLSNPILPFMPPRTILPLSIIPDTNRLSFQLNRCTLFDPPLLTLFDTVL